MRGFFSDGGGGDGVSHGLSTAGGGQSAIVSNRGVSECLLYYAWFMVRSNDIMP